MLALLTHAEHEGTGAFWEKRGNAAPPGPGRLQRVEWHMLSRYLAAAGVVSTANKAYRFNAAVARPRAGYNCSGLQGSMDHGPNEPGDGGDVRVRLWSINLPAFQIVIEVSFVYVGI